MSAVSAWVFFGNSSELARSWLVFPVLLWSSLMFGVRGATLALLPPTILGVAGTTTGTGLLGGSSVTDVDNYPNRAGQTGTQAMTIPRDATGGPKEGGAARSTRVKKMEQQLKEKMQANEVLRRLAKQVRMVDTTQGIRIDLVDNADFSMFMLGTTVLTPDASQLLKVIGDTVAPQGGGLTIRGHTDSLPWKSGAANNWSLSAGRAEATRQSLMRSGISEDRFRRIEGVADRELLVRDNPQDPRNRRISILLQD